MQGLFLIILPRSDVRSVGRAREYYCFLDRYSDYNQITIALEDQEKTIFMCMYGMFAFRRMPFGLCNASSTFQRCMMDGHILKNGKVDN